MAAPVILTVTGDGIRTQFMAATAAVFLQAVRDRFGEGTVENANGVVLTTECGTLEAGNYRWTKKPEANTSGDGGGGGGSSGGQGNFHPSRRIISVNAMQLVERASFLIKRGSSSNEEMRDSSQAGSSSSETSTNPASYVGVGVFVTNKRAVTVNHNLGAATSLDIYIPSQRTTLEVHVVARSEEFDYAVLECTRTYPHHLQLYDGDLDILRGEALALCSFQLGIHEEMPEFSTSMGVMRVDAVKLSKRRHHLIYTSHTWPGDSGAALVMHDGQLVGLHIAGVNSLRESFNRMHDLEERVSAVEDSLELAANSVATGCVALLAHTFAGAL